MSKTKSTYFQTDHRDFDTSFKAIDSRYAAWYKKNGWNNSYITSGKE